MPPRKKKVNLSDYPDHVIARALLLAEQAEPTYQPKYIIAADQVRDLVLPLIFGATSEHLILLCLSRTQKLLACEVVSMGGRAATIVDPAIIFRRAITLDAAAIILAHNHPSGDPEPSQEDVTVTERIVRGGSLLNIPLLDHLVVTDDGRFTSMNARNLMAQPSFKSYMTGAQLV